MSQLSPRRAVFLVARREFLGRVRTRAFVLGTLVVLVLLGAYGVFQATLITSNSTSTVAFSGQATVLADPLRQTAAAFGETVETSDVTDVAAAEQQVRDGDLDALITGAPDALRVVVKDSLGDALRNSLDAVVKQQALDAQLAEGGLDPAVVARNLADAGAEVTALEPRDDQRGQRFAVGLVVAALLYYSLLVYGTMVAQGVVEEKSSRVVEVLLATLRPWQLLLGKVLGLGAVGLLQFVVLAGVGLVVAAVSGVLDGVSVAGTSLVTGVVWYLLGFFLYATVFAAAGALVSRQEELQAVVMPINTVIVVAFVAGVGLLGQDPDGTTVAVMSVLPPFAPLLMPSRMAMGVAPLWQVGLAVVLALAAIALITWIGGRVYGNAVLRAGARVKLRDALRA
ncbi:ABC transporter permease [Umezawaea beigongshangensis]|uniref:ABC transporter permease n=1 Tax=Umezawaea beigongshangensis TaxID=2780383 RepID=UPI0018F1527B|nr:ABC transporter permease [Umezawaea beigongshangensis]